MQDDGWESQGGYMAAKMSKLGKQFIEGIGAQKSDIFNGVSIFVNGYTDPSDYILKKIMQENGGKYNSYYSPDSVTHIIANVLPKSKIDKLKHQRIIKPLWITDSLEAGKLLDWTEYQLYADRFKSDQNVMKDFLKTNENESESQVSLDIYYQKSRLHHLSTWVTQLTDFLAEIKRQNSQLNFPDRDDFRKMYCHEFIFDCDNTETSWIMHVDIDCFFVSVGLKNYPELRGQPIAVAHSKGKLKETNSMSEIASCSYEARKFGVKNGMLLGRAKKLCPQLQIIPYDFESYFNVSKSLYRIVTTYTHDIQVGSCDELYLKLNDIITCYENGRMQVIDPIKFANHLRAQFFAETQCSLSCGIARNMFSAKLATDLGKPDGAYWLSTDTELQEVIKSKSVRVLPGIGRSLEVKLSEMQVTTCADLQRISRPTLQSKFGNKIGQRLYDNCRGKDNRVLQVDKQRQSISAEINYGIRMNNFDQLEQFLEQLATELSNRMKAASVLGEFLMLKIMIRHPDAQKESKKYLGHGICDNYSRSTKLPILTDSSKKISEVALTLYKQLNKPIDDLRGIGLTISKLQNTNLSIAKRPGISDYFKTPNSANPTCLVPSTSAAVVTNDNSSTGSKDDVVNDYDNEDFIVLSDDEDVDQIPEITNCNLVQSSSVNKTKTAAASISKKKLKQKGQLRIDDLMKKKSNTDPPINKKVDDKKENEYVMHIDDDENNDTTNVEDFIIKLGESDMDKFYKALNEWIKNESEPLEEDATLIGRQLLRMVTQGRISDIHDILLFINKKIQLYHRRTTINKQSNVVNVDCIENDGFNYKKWKSCLRVFMKCIQEKCVTEFGARLNLNIDIDLLCESV